MLTNMAFDLGMLPAVGLSYLLITPVIWVALVHPFFWPVTLIHWEASYTLTVSLTR